MISITITGQTLEEFKAKLEQVVIEFLTEKENKVISNSSDVATENGVQNEEESSKETSKKREVILPEFTPKVITDGVKSLNEATSIKRKSKKISAKVEPVVYNTEVLKENPQIDLSEMKLPSLGKEYSTEEVTKMFKDVIAKGREKAIEVLSQFSVTKFSELDPSKHQEFALACDKILND